MADAHDRNGHQRLAADCQPDGANLIRFRPPSPRGAATPDDRSEPDRVVLNLAVIGGGYVGLVTAACLADSGHRVAVVETDPVRVAALAAGRVPIHEPGLDRLVERNLRHGRLTFTGEAEAAVAPADAVFIAVGTPQADNGDADLSQVHAAVHAIAPALRADAVVVVKSTVTVGTCDRIEDILGRQRADARIAVVSNPEFLRAGAAVDDFMHPHRIVVGTSDPRARVVMSNVYRPFTGRAPIVFTDRRSAELAKYAANGFLATKITFMNEIADLCEAVGADVQDIARCMGLDGRIGREFLQPGPGIGGSCFPKDTLALSRTGEANDVALSIVSAVSAADRRRKSRLADRVVAALGGAAGRTVAVLGLTFKPDTDDLRESPSLALVPALQSAGARVRAYDPRGMTAAMPLLPAVTFARDPYDCAEGADALVVVTDWSEFRALDLARLGQAMARPLVVDLRNIYRPLDMQAAGFEYHSVGRRIVRPVETVAERTQKTPVAAAPQGTSRIRRIGLSRLDELLAPTRTNPARA